MAREVTKWRGHNKIGCLVEGSARASARRGTCLVRCEVELAYGGKQNNENSTSRPSKDVVYDRTRKMVLNEE